MTQRRGGIWDRLGRVTARGPLRGRHVLVTAGPTRAPIDRVRYIANTSTGATGVAVARALWRRGAQVHFVYGPGEVPPPAGVRVLPVETPDEMREAVLSVIGAHPVAAAVLAAAVLDFVPATYRDEKIPSGDPLTVELVPTRKLIAEVVRLAPTARVVGFKLEDRKSDEELATIALGFIGRHGLSAVLANDVARIGRGAHPALLVTAEGAVTPLAGKEAIAAAITDHLERALSAAGRERR
jgi:phosphopantothenoylcysteine decarboxylase/phosphopantothenate--cysteine ligase